MFCPIALSIFSTRASSATIEKKSSEDVNDEKDVNNVNNVNNANNANDANDANNANNANDAKDAKDIKDIKPNAEYEITITHSHAFKFLGYRFVLRCSWCSPGAALPYGRAANSIIMLPGSIPKTPSM